MIELRPYERLGRFQIDWLDARHHFNFGHYREKGRDGWGPLVVWNDDAIRPGTGFDPHPHRDMEIITYVRSGAITHQDHMGNRGRTGAGDVQVMSAGRGVVHAEYNLEDADTTLFQIWILPDRSGHEPRWDAKEFPRGDRAGQLVVLASGRPQDEGTGALMIHQDAALVGATLGPGQTAQWSLAEGRRAYLVAARGSVEVNGVRVGPRDGAAIAEERTLSIRALDEEAEILLADLP